MEMSWDGAMALTVRPCPPPPPARRTVEVLIPHPVPVKVTLFDNRVFADE